MLEVYTDASADQQHAVIGFMVYENHQLIDSQTRVIKGVHSNLAELLSVLFVMTVYKQPLNIHCDSTYVVNIFNGTFQAKKHTELWDTAFDLLENSHSHITYVKGHDKNERNKSVDKLVRQTLREYRKSKGR